MQYCKFLLFLCLTAVFACSKSNDGQEPSPTPAPDVDPSGETVVPGLIFNVSLPAGSPAVWTEESVISVSGIASAEISSISGNGKTASFTVPISEASTYEIVSPAGSEIFPPVQKYYPGESDPAAHIYKGITSSRTASLAPCFSLIKITPAKGDVQTKLKAICIEAIAGESISGYIPRTTLEMPEEGGEFGETYNVCIPAQHYDGGIRLILEAADGTRMYHSLPEFTTAESEQTYGINVPEYLPAMISVYSVDAITGSSAALMWSASDPEDNPGKLWRIHVYSDKNCSEKILCVEIAQGDAVIDENTCGYSIGGLSPGSECWIIIEDVEGGHFSESFRLALPDFGQIALPVEVTTAGTVLAEDFRASINGDDPYGNLPGVTDNVPSGICDIHGLEAWHSEGSVTFHPGYVGISAGKVITPPFDIAGGNKAGADVKLKVAGSGVLSVCVSAPPSYQIDKDNEHQYKEVSLKGVSSWEEIFFEDMTVEPGGRIAITAESGHVYLSEISVGVNAIYSVYAALADASSSTLSFRWTEGGTENADAGVSYTAVLYGDASCTDEVQSVTIPSGTFGNGFRPAFIFAGLEQDKSYWFKVTDNTNGLESDVLDARTMSFAPVVLPAEIKKTGIILSEDFSEFKWDTDILTGAAGISMTGSIAAPGKASLYPFKEQSGFLPGSRLAGWAADSNVALHPGTMEIGKSGGKGWLFTPEIPAPKEGSITVDVTLTASSYSNPENGLWCIAVMDHENANVTGWAADFGHHPDASNTGKIQFFTLDKPLSWQTLSAKGLIVEPGDRIMFGVKGSYTASGSNARALVRDISINVTGISAIEDPLVFEDGTKVETYAQWNDRCEEILEIFQAEMYGRIPDVSQVYIDRIEKGNTSVKGQPAVREQYRMWFNEERTGPKVDWLIVRPRNASGPAPVIMTLNYWGNHVFLPDTQIVVPDCWLENDSNFGITGNRAQESARGILLEEGRRYYYPIDQFLQKGYAFVSACYGEISPDPEDTSKQAGMAYTGIFDLWGPRDYSRSDNTMALGAWSWVLMRGMDMIEGRSELAADKVLVTGCSRLGKAALIAAAFDGRFAAVAPVQTGTGGVPLSKHIISGKETIADITTNYTHWFCNAFLKYAGNESSMPFDQHLFISCVAPRPILVCGYNNDHFDPQGEFLALRAATPVWKFLGKTGLPEVSFPATDAPSAIGLDMGYVRRDGEHGVVQSDWRYILEFTDKHFK